MSTTVGLVVSVITPTLNAARDLDECIRSVLDQDYQQIEHVFVDGGSTDNTLDILGNYARRYPGRLRIMIEPGTGPGEAWNRGAKASTGQVLTCLGADDVCEPGAVSAVVSFFSTHSEAQFVHGECDVIDARGVLLRRHQVEPFDLQEFLDTARHIATPSAYYRRELMERINWLDSSGDDFDVMIRMAKQCQIHGIHRVLSKLRIRDDSAFNPVELGARLAQLSHVYRVSRYYGGSRTSRLAIRYYVYWLLSALRLKFPYQVLRKWRAS